MKLQAKDFRIGNFVEYDNRVFEIDSISNDFPTLNSIEFGVGVVDWNNLQPIPLTENWLLDFGFEVKNFDYTTPISECKVVTLTLIPHDEQHSSLTVCVTQKDEDFFEVNENVILSDISFVHQLQNLFFALSGEELQIKDNGK